MATKSSVAKRNYAPGTSRRPRSVDTLRAQMEDLARGERIKALREERHLTQPAVIELFEELARRRGWEPKKPGERPLTLRGYQAWEAGGGIKWENVKVLAAVFAEEPEFIMSGRQGGIGRIPDLSLIQGAAREEQLDDVDTKFSKRVDKVEQRLKRIEDALIDDEQSVRALLKKQTELLEDIRTLVGDEDAFAVFRRALGR